MKRPVIALFAAFVLFATSALAAAPSFQISKEGELERPQGYREWIFVGAPVTPNDLNDGKAAFPEFHNVYIDPVSWRQWKKSGTFPDGTILVKELVSVGDKQATSGNGYFEGDFLGLEAAVKSKKHFPNEPGYWAYFSFSTPDHRTLNKSASAFPAASCNACHEGAAAEDWVFTQYYPVLRAARAAGEKGEGGVRDTLPKTASGASNE